MQNSEQTNASVDTPPVNVASEEQSQSQIPKAPSRKRFFTWKEKEDCWEKSPYMFGRHPDRWRLDAFGNPVNKFLKGCMGPHCYEYDHIVPFSKGGESILENCQILNTYLNRAKSNRTDISFSEFRGISPKYMVTEEELDIIEKSVFGNIQRVDVTAYMRQKVVQEGDKPAPIPATEKKFTEWNEPSTFVNNEGTRNEQTPKSRTRNQPKDA